MNRFLFILLLCMGLANTTPAQQYFNTRDPLNSFFSMLTSVVPVEDKYYCAGFSWDSSNYIGNGIAKGIEGVVFAVFDQQGNRLLHTNYQKDDRDIATWNSKLLPQSDGTFLLGAEEGDTNGNKYLIVIRLDTLGNILWEKEYPKPVCQGITNDFWSFIDLQPDGHGNWLLLSTIKCNPTGNASQHDLFLMKLDSNFELLWFKQYGSSTLNDIGTKILVEHDGYILAGGRNNTNIVRLGFSFHAELIKIDHNGNILWTWLSNAAKKTLYARDVIRTQDGGYVYCGQGDGYEYVSANGQYSIPEFRGWVEKLDSNRNVIWNVTINDVYSNWSSTEQRVLKELGNGDIVAAGSLWDKYNASDTELHHYGVLTRIDPAGNIVWQRKHKYGNDTLTYLLYDMKLTDDGGFVFCGEATDKYYPYVAPTQRGWIVKTDSNGCLGPGDPQCWPLSVTNAQPGHSVTVYPNPVKDHWHIRNTEEKQIRVIITDITGRVLLENTNAAPKISFDLRGYAPGIYLYRLSSGGKMLLQGKLLKE